MYGVRTAPIGAFFSFFIISRSGYPPVGKVTDYCGAGIRPWEKSRITTERISARGKSHGIIRSGYPPVGKVTDYFGADIRPWEKSRITTERLSARGKSHGLLRSWISARGKSHGYPPVEKVTDYYGEVISPWEKSWITTERISALEHVTERSGYPLAGKVTGCHGADVLRHK